MERECDNCKYRDVYYKAPPCDECNEYQNWESADAMTNADRIRTMTDEDLAKFITEVDLCELLCGSPSVCDGYWSCERKMLNWLKEEAEEGKE